MASFLMTFLKDWKYAHDNELGTSVRGKPRVSRRPFGWIDFVFQGGSSVQVNVPMVLSEEGSTITFDISLQSTKLISSVNYATLLLANCLQV
jgi:hypothetical protein